MFYMHNYTTEVQFCLMDKYNPKFPMPDTAAFLNGKFFLKTQFSKNQNLMAMALAPISFRYCMPLNLMR